MTEGRNTQIGVGYELTDDDYGPFDGFSRADFERWLTTGMEAYFHERRSPDAFSGADGYIRRREYLVEGLEDVYLGWNAEQQGLFRVALADVIASLPAYARNAIIFEHLLSLAASLNAVDILRVLPVRIGTDDFGRMVASDGSCLFDVAILTVARLSAPREDVLTCLRALVGSRQFDAAYAGTVLLALCRADAGALPEHLELLRGSLARMFQAYDPDGEVRRYLATEVLNTIGMEHLRSALVKMRYYGRDELSDAWLAEALLSGDHSPVDWSRAQSGGILLWRREARDIRVQVPPPSRQCPLPAPSPSIQRRPDAWATFDMDRQQAEQVLAKGPE